MRYNWIVISSDNIQQLQIKNNHNSSRTPIDIEKLARETEKFSFSGTNIKNKQHDDIFQIVLRLLRPFGTLHFA